MSYEREELIRIISEEIRLDPGDFWAWMARADAYANNGDYDRAILDYEDACDFQPEWDDGTRNWTGDGGIVWLNRASDNISKGDYEQAIRDCGIAIWLDPNDIWAWTGRGDAWIERSGGWIDSKAYFATHGKTYAYDLDEAIADYSEAIRLEPKETYAWISRGEAYAVIGDYGKAIKDYSEVIKLYPDAAGAWRKRGDAYKDLGDEAKSRADFLKAEELEAKAKSKP